jgi:hypothetical protein
MLLLRVDESSEEGGRKFLRSFGNPDYKISSQKTLFTARDVRTSYFAEELEITTLQKCELVCVHGNEGSQAAQKCMEEL